MDLLILLLTSVINLLLGAIVFFRDLRRPYAQTFALISVWITVWIIANFITNHYVADLTVTSFANKLAYVSGFGVVVSGLLFTYFFPIPRKVSMKEKMMIIIPTVVIIGLSFTEFIAGVVTLSPDGTLLYSTPPLLWLYIVCYVAVVGMIARNLLLIPHSESWLKRRQARLIWIAFSSSALLGLFLNVVLPSIGALWGTTRFGPLVTIILVGTIAYTIIKHRLFDIRLAVIRGVAYVSSLLTLAGLYYVAAFAVSELILYQQNPDIISQSPANIILALVLAFIFQPIKRFFDRLTNQIFYRDNYSTDEFLARLGEKLSATTNLEGLLRLAASEVGSTLQAEQSFFFIRYGASSHVLVGSRHKRHIKIAEMPLVDAIAKTSSKPIVTALLSEKSKAYELLTSYNIAIVLPLRRSSGLLGYLFLGERRSRQYAARDIRVLGTIADELIIAIQNSLSVQEVKEINATLQQRIEEATKELRATNAELQRLDEAKDEFVSMASHQLRTPLTSVKGYISMVLEGDAGKLTAMQRQLLGESFISSERMVHLINDFLNVSRLQTGKFMLDRHQTNLAKLVEKEVNGLQTTARMHQMEIRYHAPSYFPQLYLDEGKIRQVIMNFIDNAIYYSKEGDAITVQLSIVDGDAVFEVKDEGIGVPAAEQSRLFGKFFRATNARKQRPDGTGVGLFLAKKVIVAHGGSMVFESTEGKGSTFGFRLPIKKLSHAPADSTDKLEK